MQRALGIDLGTTNSVMAYNKRGQPVIIPNLETNQDITPSVVGRDSDGQLLVGEPAKGQAIVSPEQTVYSIKRFIGRKYGDPKVKRAIQGDGDHVGVGYRVTEAPAGDVSVWLGDREYTPTEISSIILHRLRRDAEARTGEQFTRAVITVPAYFGERQVAATRDAGEMAGFHVLLIVNEPTAAALAFGYEREDPGQPKTIMVYDLGGGTFDISIILLMEGAPTVLGIEGDNFLGGDDFDNDVTRWLLGETLKLKGRDPRGDRQANPVYRQVEAVYRQAAERAKIALSSLISTKIPLSAVGNPPISLTPVLTREQFEGLIRAHIDETIQRTEKALKKANLTTDQIDGVLLVGGSSAIPLVVNGLSALFGPGKLRRDVNPMQCVALGAAIQGALLPETACSKCQHRNSVQDDYCQACGAPLFGHTKSTCPQCFVPCDAEADACWKCGIRLEADGHSPAAEATVSVACAFERCPNCGSPYKVGLSACPVCNEVLIDEGGLRCPECGAINAPGALTCKKCEKDMPVTNPQDITPMPLGVELDDGRCATVIPEGTPYPTLAPLFRDFFTAVAAQPRLDVNVYEGENPMASQNQLVGVVSKPLPEGLPKGTRIKIGLGLGSDLNRILTVRVEIPGVPGEAKTREIQRSRIDPEKRQQIETFRAKLTAFTEQWSRELTPAETSLIEALLDQVDSALNQDYGSGDAARRSLESLLAHADKTLESVSQARSSEAIVSGIVGYTAAYLPDEKCNKLKQLAERLNNARQQDN
jgi:molecular chaperone DnaK